LLIFELNSAKNSNHPARLGLRVIEHHLCKIFAQTPLDGLLHLTASLSCGIGVDSLAWSKEDLTPILITFRGQTILGLAYTSLVNQYTQKKCEFCLVEITGALILVAKVAEPPIYRKCFYPCDPAIWTDTRGDEIAAALAGMP
jgi:hypothetical protein